MLTRGISAFVVGSQENNHHNTRSGYLQMRTPNSTVSG